MSFLRLPVELHLNIGERLSWQDLYSLIKSNSHFVDIHSPRLLPLAAQEDGQTLLLWAAETGDEPFTRLLLEEHNILVTPLNESPGELQVCTSALHVASYYGHINIVRLLLEKGAGVNVRLVGKKTDTSGWASPRPVYPPRKQHDDYWDWPNLQAPITLAVQQGNGEIIRLLVAAGADPESLDGNGHTPLFVAVEKGHEAIVRFLVIEMSVKDDRYTCALVPAVYPFWQEVMVDLLLQSAESDIRSTTDMLFEFTGPEDHKEILEINAKLHQRATDLGVPQTGAF